MRVLILSCDAYLIRKAELELSADAEIVTDISLADVLIYDADSEIEMPKFHGKMIKLSRMEIPGTEALPIERGRLLKLIKSDNTAALSLLAGERSVVFKGKKIKLTSHEYSLLSLLMSSTGYTSREEIASKVWGDATDGLINIYIHYLREKLESDGDKVILSSRKYGYKINEKYTEVGLC